MTGVVGVLLARKSRLLVVCQECEFKAEGSLETIARAKGMDFDLTDQRTPCKVEGCGYWLGFYVQHGMAMRALLSAEGAVREREDRSRWLAEGNGARRYALKSKNPPRREPERA